MRNPGKTRHESNIPDGNRENGRFEKFGGTRKFGTFMLSGKNGTFKTFGRIFVVWAPTFVVK